jgi:nitrous oxidase accessory protein NosD
LKPIQYNNLEDIWGDGISVGSEDVENITIQYNNITGTHTEEVISYGIDAGGVNITIQRNNISSFDIGICSSLLNSFIRNNTVTNISGYGIEVRGDYCDGESELIYWSSPSGETDEIAVEQCSAIEFTVPEDVYYISLVNILPDYWVYCNEAIYCAGFSEVLTTDTEQWLTYEEHLDSGDDENNAILISEPFGVTPGETLFVIWYFEPYDCSHYDVTYYLAEEDLDFTSYYYDEGFEELEDDYYVEIYGYTCYKSGYYLTENNNITGTKEIDTETDYQSGIQMTNVVNAETRYNNISIFDNGIYMDECSITCTDNNTISNVSDAGIALLGHSHHLIEYNNITALYWDDGEFLYYGDDGIYIDDESYVTIQYNNISFVDNGVYIIRSDYTYTMNNTITNFSRNGISILGVIPECLLEGTQILMSDGSKKPIEDIQVGDVVKGHSDENTVYDLYHYILGDNLVYSINDGKYFVTGPHPFMTTEGWKAFEPIRAKEFNPQLEINQLEIGDILLTIDGTIELKTISTKEFPYDTPIYNFAVTGDETYYGDGYLVHNKCPRVFSKSGDDYVFDVLINVEFVGVENDKLYRFPLKYFNANEPKIKIVNDPLEYNYIDFVKIIVTDTSESGDEVKTTILDPIDILCNNCTNTSCNLSLLLERDGKYLENDKKVNSEIFITFEDAPILKEGYTRDIEIYSGGYQDIYESFVPDCRCIEEFLYYYWTHSIRTDEICYYSLEPIALLGHSHHLIEYNNLTGDMELLGEEGSIGIGIALEDDVTIQYNNISFVVYGVNIIYSDHTYTENNTISSMWYGVLISNEEDGGGGDPGSSYHTIEYNNITLLYFEGFPFETIGVGIIEEEYITTRFNNISDYDGGVYIYVSDVTYTYNNTITNATDYGIWIRSEGVVDSDHLIEYNNITGDSEEASIGILLEDEDNVTIQYNNISFFDMGIFISSSSLTFTKNNTITDVVSYGIYIMGNMVASDHLIEYNYIVEGESILEEVSIGVYVEQEENVTIRYNDISYFHTAGISTVYCYDIYIHDNTFSLMYQYVIKSEYDYFVEIYNHDLSSSDCESDLIYIEYAQFAQIYFNTLDNAGSGLFIKGCDNLAVYTNYFRDNDYGILMLEGETIVDFLCFNNYFDNAESNVCCPYDQEDIQWNITKTLGTNIIGGPYLMGNYWSDYAGVDDDDDGIGDTSYEVPTCLL